MIVNHFQEKSYESKTEEGCRVGDDGFGNVAYNAEGTGFYQ